MKNLNLKIKASLLLSVLFLVSACSEDFLNRPPEDSVALDNFYSSEEELIANANVLYGTVWFNFNSKAFWSITELTGGNARTFSGDVINFGNFTVTGDNNELTNGWESLWGVVAQSNAIINFVPERVAGSVPQAAVDNVLGEAHFMRAVAYFYLVRIWGAVPIIENNLENVYDPQIPTNRVEDIYEFMERDLQFAIDNCYEKTRGGNYEANIHVSSGSAKALKAKVHLYQEEYDEARQLAEEVINSGEFKLFGIDIPSKSYSDLFLTANNNNEESIVQMQWSSQGYGVGNAMQASFAISSQITGTGDGYSVIGPTIDLQEAYEDGDERRKATIMLANDYYPSILSSEGGFTVPDDINAQNTKAGIKKYVVGTPEDNGGEGAAQAAPNNTYIMRYADVLLIHAEAILAGQESTSNVAALNSFNAIRERAGLGSLPSITLENILQERRLEFAIEGEYWFDLGRIDRQMAIEIISNQERGTYSNDTPPVIYSQKFTPSAEDFTMPYPSSDVALNPRLLEEPQPYNFN
ncbi:RagB/SusD family nutrient uptake outer membrane protein [Mesonia aestuariivivens]|uniref:RagB/SusD family nutrient uptake outer membrane protein n=1 Tax=Mesonia aestuariivivens TaxID=2796128 RepID=A0ABS6W6G6_9FLAO|nr:RagB/SusD family nutrient uptake outer membrane protein [Mesonia aestuariivivens]MBW2962729.1 RagB/SusD family nutrient uptake outer membrane protein [Mesonia aestuariivivens]